MTKILLVGSGAREHAIARAIHNSQGEVWSVIDKKNPGIMELSTRVFSGEKQPEEWIDVVSANVDAAIIGPEAPLAVGIADLLEDHGVPTLGPPKKAARIETSKEFSRILMKKYDIIGRPEFRVCTTKKQVETALEELGINVAIKPDGLTGGKGVWVHGDHFKTRDEALEYAVNVLESHGSIVIEEKLEGLEFTAQFLTNGKEAVPFPLVRDFKRAYNNDKGPNTGSMGSISYPDHNLPYLTSKDLETIQQIANDTLTAIRLETRTEYKGILYVQAMKTKTGVKVIEYNARFGDPEAINVLGLLDSSFTDAILLASQGKTPKLRFKSLATTCVYLTPTGYPVKPEKNQPIKINNQVPKDAIYFGSVNKQDNGEITTTTSRAIAVLGVGETLKHARKQAYNIVKHIKGNLHYRTDIGLEKRKNTSEKKEK